MEIQFNTTTARLHLVGNGKAEQQELVKLSAVMRKRDVATTIRSAGGRTELIVTPTKARFVMACRQFADEQTSGL